MRIQRWLGFVGAVTALFILTSGIVSIQWMGWALSSVSCAAWAYFAYKDRDMPRMLMEMFYFGAAFLGIHNWYGQ
jgi:hypothetical protein